LNQHPAKIEEQNVLSKSPKIRKSRKMNPEKSEMLEQTINRLYSRKTKEQNVEKYT
jgi:hypothetical protein